MSRTRHRERARDPAPGTPGCGLGSPRNWPERDRRVHGWSTRHAAREAILGCMALRAARILGHPWPASTHAHQPTSLSRHPRDDVRCAFACCWIDAVSDACARRKARCVVIRSSSSGCVASLTATKLHHRCSPWACLNATTASRARERPRPRAPLGAALESSASSPSAPSTRLSAALGMGAAKACPLCNLRDPRSHHRDGALVRRRPSMGAGAVARPDARAAAHTTRR